MDSRFNSVEDSLTVRVSDILLPNVQTGEATVNNSNLNLNAMFTRFGDLTDDLKFGFYLSAEPILDPSQSGVEKYSAPQ